MTKRKRTLNTRTTVLAFNRLNEHLKSIGSDEWKVHVGDALSLAAGDPYVVSYPVPPGCYAPDLLKPFEDNLRQRGFHRETNPMWVTVIHPGVDKKREAHLKDRHESLMMDLATYLLHPCRMRASGQFHAILATLLGSIDHHRC
jgi:hypothetical protein